MANIISQKDRIDPQERQLSLGIGPSVKAIPGLRKNKPGQSVGIGYLDDGLRASFHTGKHVFKK